MAGFMYEHVLREVDRENVIIVRNPFYATTSSIASLWFAKNYLERDNVTILSSDIVLEDRLIEEIICQNTDKPYVLVDSSKTTGKYNVQVQGDKVCVMINHYRPFYYVCITKLDAISTRSCLKIIL